MFLGQCFNQTYVQEARFLAGCITVNFSKVGLSPNTICSRRIASTSLPLRARQRLVHLQLCATSNQATYIAAPTQCICTRNTNPIYISWAWGTGHGEKGSRESGRRKAYTLGGAMKPTLRSQQPPSAVNIHRDGPGLAGSGRNVPGRARPCRNRSGRDCTLVKESGANNG